MKFFIIVNFLNLNKSHANFNLLKRFEILFNLTNTNNMVVIDKNYALEVKPENLHLLQGVPQLTDNLINKLTENHINFDVFNMQETGNFLDNIPFDLKLSSLCKLLIEAKAK